ncbi:hypothetical protein ACJZ2D_014937 [Fusarium nematophilum]
MVDIAMTPAKSLDPVNTEQQNFQHQLPSIPENSVVATWRHAGVTTQQSSRQACFVSRLSSELATARADNRHLQDICKQASFESGCWRKEYEELLAAYWKVSEQHANLLGQNWRLREQVRAAKSRRVGREVRRDNRGIPVSVSAGADAAVEAGNDSGVDRSSEDDHVKQESNA